MPKRYHINAEQVIEIESARRKNKDKTIETRLKILLLHSEGKSRSEIAEKTEYAKSSISEVVSRYCNKGISAITSPHYGGNNRNLSYAEEEALLEPFRQAAEKGQIIEISEIKRAYEEKLGREIKSRGHIYYILEKHGWRKVMPRSKHPNKASDEAIEASKKLTLKSRS